MNVVTMPILINKNQAKFENKHEELVSKFLINSMGAPFVFSPNIYSKGDKGATRQPCDIAWVCGETAILMNLSESQAECPNNHNLKQFRGWLKKWSQGTLLEGNNDIKNFSISYESIKYIILISLGTNQNIKTQFLWNELRYIKPKFPKVIACVSLADVTIGFLAEEGASIVDLVRFVISTTDLINPETALETNNRIKDAHWLASCNLSEKLKTDVIASKRIFLTARSTNERFCEAFNDITWFDFNIICSDISEHIRTIESVAFGENGPRAITFRKTMSNRKFLISIIALSERNNKWNQDTIRSINEKLEIEYKEENILAPIIIIITLVGNNLWVPILIGDDYEEQLARTTNRQLILSGFAEFIEDSLLMPESKGSPYNVFVS